MVGGSGWIEVDIKQTEALDGVAVCLCFMFYDRKTHKQECIDMK